MVLIAAVGALVAAPMAGPSSAIPSSAISSSVVSSSVSARSGSAETGAVLVVVSHNLEKRQSALSRALRAARARDASVIALQEVCGWQAADLTSSRPEWTVTYRPEHVHATCRRSAERSGSTSRRSRTIGNAVIWTGGSDGKSTRYTFGHQRSPADRTGMACVKWIDASAHRACSLHLIAPNNGAEIRVRTRAAKDVAARARGWIERGEQVVLAGDFNAEPRRRTMSYLYAKDQDGSGQFLEADRRSAPSSTCGCPKVTLPARDVKIDYVFFSADSLGTPSHRRLSTIRTTSDHHLLVGGARVDQEPSSSKASRS